MLVVLLGEKDTALPVFRDHFLWPLYDLGGLSYSFQKGSTFEHIASFLCVLGPFRKVGLDMRDSVLVGVFPVS